MDAFSKVGLNSLQTPVLEGSQNRECLICLPVYTTSAWMATPVRRVAGFNQQLHSVVVWELTHQRQVTHRAPPWT